MTDVGFVISDKMKVVGWRPSGRTQVHIHQRILLIGDAAQIKLSMKANKNSVVQTDRKTRGSEGNVIGAFAFRARDWVRQRLKCNQRLNALPADNPSGPIFNVVGGKAKKPHWRHAELGRWYEIQFIRAQWLVGIHQA